MLDPQVQALLAMFSAAPAVDYASVTPQALRAINDLPMAFGAPPEVARVEDVTLPLPGRSIAARLYVPEGAGETPPLVVYYHGGGWVMGTLDTHDATCRLLARESGAAVLSVAYRLAPEHAFPTPMDDCYDALLWAAANGKALGVDASRLAVAGDSAGGNLAAAVAIRARDEGGPVLRHQFLAYPVTANDFANSSYAQNGDGRYFLSTAAMRWFWQQYLGSGTTGHVPLASVLGTPDLSGLPPATVITAEYDPLRDEGMAYATRLADAGVTVDAVAAPGMIHGFLSMFQAVPGALQWMERAGRGLRESLA